MKRFRTHFLFIAGYILLIGGATDPLEGSIVIGIGSALVAISAIYSHDHYRKYYLSAFILILIGIFFMWYVSSLGGFDPKTERYRFVPLSPYPIGWIMSIALLIIKAIKKK